MTYEPATAAKKSGKTVDDVVKTWATPAKYKGYPAANPDRVRADATVFWDETKSRPHRGAPLPRVPLPAQGLICASGALSTSFTK